MNGHSLLDLSVREFLSQLASAAPTPGGGSAGALAGALAAGLGRMSAALTIGRPKFAAVEEEVRRLDGRLARAAALLAELVDEDARAYGELSAAFKLGKDDPQRAARIAQAAGLAAAVPLEVAAIARRIEADLGRLETQCNPNLASDVRAGRALAQAATAAAAAMVRVNLSLLPAEQAQAVEKELAVLVSG